MLIPRPIEIDLLKRTGQTEIVFVNESKEEWKLRLTADITGPKAGKSEFTLTKQKDQPGLSPFEATVPAKGDLRIGITANKI